MGRFGSGTRRPDNRPTCWAVTPAGSMRCVRWSPDGRRLAIASITGSVWIWNADGRQGAQLVAGHGHGMDTAVAWSPDSKRLAGGGEDQMVRICDPEAGRLVLTLHGHTK